MTRLRALLWDVDGTLAETERDGHRVAFNHAFEEFGLPWRWDEALYGRLLHVTGGRERLLSDMATRADAPLAAADRDALARALHEKKNEVYAALVDAGTIPLRDGVLALMDEAAARGIRQAIATTTSRANLDALLRFHLGPRWRQRFAAVVCGEDVQRKKPDPEVYLRALEALAVDPLAALAIEDSPGGVAAAQAAGIPVIVTESAYFAGSTIEEAVAIGPGFGTRRGWRPVPPSSLDAPVGIDDLQAWVEEGALVSQVP